ncbi:hypothetical protein ACFLT1_05065 [Bacteroidota bacterium]
MKHFIQSLIFFLGFLIIGGTLIAQSPVTIIYKGAINHDNGLPVINEVCTVYFSIINTEGNIYCNKEVQITTSDSGTFVMAIEEIPSIFEENSERKEAGIHLKINAAEGSNWLTKNPLEMIYILEKTSADEYVMYTFEGQSLSFKTMKPVWEFSDINYTDQLFNKFIVSFNEEYADIESIEVISKMINGSTDIKKATPSPRKRGIKGGFAVGGYKKKDN